MIGIYLLLKTDTKMGLQDMVREPSFMPVMSISEEYDLKPYKNGYFIMPTTYQSKINGNFILSVTASQDFTLTSLK